MKEKGFRLEGDELIAYENPFKSPLGENEEIRISEHHKEVYKVPVGMFAYTEKASFWGDHSNLAVPFDVAWKMAGGNIADLSVDRLEELRGAIRVVYG